MKKDRKWRQQRHQTRIKRQKKNRARRSNHDHFSIVSSRDRSHIIAADVLDEKQVEDPRKAKHRFFRSNVPPIIPEIILRKVKRIYELQKKI